MPSRPCASSGRSVDRRWRCGGSCDAPPSQPGVSTTRRRRLECMRASYTGEGCTPATCAQPEGPARDRRQSPLARLQSPARCDRGRTGLPVSVYPELRGRHHPVDPGDPGAPPPVGDQTDPGANLVCSAREAGTGKVVVKGKGTIPTVEKDCGKGGGVRIPFY